MKRRKYKTVGNPPAIAASEKTPSSYSLKDVKAARHKVEEADRALCTNSKGEIVPILFPVGD